MSLSFKLLFVCDVVLLLYRTITIYNLYFLLRPKNEKKKIMFNYDMFFF